jgi:hypothetical protein
MNWEKIIEILTAPNSIFFLIFLLVVIIFLAVLGKKGILMFDIKGIKLGYSEQERTIIRQQSEWAKLYCDSMEPRLPHPEGYDVWRSKYILECVYDEIMTWITYNHITMNESYVEIKQNKLVFLINSLTIKDEYHSEEFNDMVRKETKFIISKLVQIRELYSK